MDGKYWLSVFLPSCPLQPENRETHLCVCHPFLAAITGILCSLGLSILYPPQCEEGQAFHNTRHCPILALHTPYFPLFGPDGLIQFSRALCQAITEALCFPLPHGYISLKKNSEKAEVLRP